VTKKTGLTEYINWKDGQLGNPTTKCMVETLSPLAKQMQE